MNARPIDHLVLPVTELDVARARLSALGFTVAPDALHPFGTANACIFFADGSYLEPLAVANRRQASSAAKRGNVFTARDLAFRGAKHREGLSALVVASDDAEADHACFMRRGFSAGEPLAFSRTMTLADGTEKQAGFRLAFAADERAPDLFMFACERVASMPIDRGGLTYHANAVVGLSEIVLSADRPAEFSSLFETVLIANARPDAPALRFAAANARVRITPQNELTAEFAINPEPQSSGLAGRAVIFKTADLAVTEITLAANDVTFIRRGGRVLVAATPGQGVLFGFEE